MDALIVVDMQAGLLIGPPKHDLPGVIARINQLAAMVRDRSGKVIWIQHCGRPDDDFAPHKPGWSFLPELDRMAIDIAVRKTMNDPFAGTDLKRTLDGIKPDRVLVAGWATDFCVDATVRSAVSNDYNVVVAGDGRLVDLLQDALGAEGAQLRRVVHDDVGQVVAGGRRVHLGLEVGERGEGVDLDLGLRGVRREDVLVLLLGVSGAPDPHLEWPTTPR